MKKSLFLNFTRLLPALFLFILASPSSAQQTLVRTDKVQRMDFYDQINLVSRTSAIRSSNVVATISGEVTRINAIEGVKVKKGTPLVSIAKERFQYALEAKAAEANQARAQAELAKRAFERSKDLFSKNLIPESSIDSDSALAVAADERYRQLKAERDRLAFDLESCIIRAPFTGFTGKQLVNLGEWVNLGTPVFELIDPSVVKVIVDLPEKYFGQVAMGSEVVITLSSDDNKSRLGRVTGFSPNAAASTHTFPVFVAVDNKDGFLGGGMLVKTTLSLSKEFSSLAVSKDAIVREGLQTMIYTVVEGKASRIPVTTSSTNGEMIAIAGEGLVEGMPVIVRGNERIFPGSPVKLQGGGTNSEHSN